MTVKLVTESKRGNHSAYGELVRRHSGYIFAICVGVLGDSHEAEDVMQETLVKGFKELKRLRKDDQFRSWLGKIARNLCIDRIRGSIKMQQIMDDPPQDVEKMPRELENLKEAISELDQGYRTPLMLFYFEGKDCKKVAEILNMEVATVRTRLSRARKLLGEILSRKETQYG